MRSILIVIDMQNDFIDGTLGTKEAEAIIEGAVKKIRSYAPEDIFATMDTHTEDYEETQEGRILPVPHCVKGTHGWQIRKEIKEALREARIFEKPSFGAGALIRELEETAKKEKLAIEMIGLCTDICVVVNALAIKTYLPEVPLRVDASLCAGTTPQMHRAALMTMRSCQILIENEEGTEY